MPPNSPSRGDKKQLAEGPSEPLSSPVAPHKDSPWPHWGARGRGRCRHNSREWGQGASTSRKGTNFISFSTSQAGHTAPLPVGDRPPPSSFPEPRPQREGPRGRGRQRSTPTEGEDREEKSEADTLQGFVS